jgi:NADPH-dependent 2,4-dienoyl-CoA reductase/sulfur reductase-like enzyme
MFLRKERIEAHLNAAMRYVDDGQVVLDDGTGIDFAYAMIVAPFVGQPVVRAAGEIADANGYVKVRDTYQTHDYDDVYAVGIAAAVALPWQTPTPVRDPQDRIPDRTTGSRRRQEHRCTNPRRAASGPQDLRRDPRNLCDGRRQQRRHHPLDHM